MSYIKRYEARKGFSLIELLIVILLVSIVYFLGFEGVEMGKKKLEATRQLQRIAALPYNHYLEKEVSKIRQKYSIPTDFEKALEWFYQEHAREYLEGAYQPLFMSWGQAPSLQSEEVLGHQMLSSSTPLWAVRSGSVTYIFAQVPGL